MDELRKAAAAARAGARLSKRVDEVLGDVVVERAGFRKGWQVLMYVTVWGVFLEAHGRAPETVRELADTIKTYEFSTMARWRRAFGAAFPEYETPAELWEQVSASITSESVEVAAMQAASTAVRVA